MIFFNCYLNRASVISLVAVFSLNGIAQTASPSRPVQPPPAASRAQSGLTLADYGVQVKPDARLIVVTAALDAAGFDAANKNISPFRQQVRRAYANLDASLRERLTRFLDAQNRRQPINANAANTTSANTEATRARQAAPFVSLAFALGDAPSFDSPARTDDLPGEVLEVLDFAALVREFYAGTNLKTELPDLLKLAQAEAESLRPDATNIVRTVIAYLRTRPETIAAERIAAPKAANKSSAKKSVSTPQFRERERRFIITPDALGVANTINFRIIGDDYFVAIAPNASANSPDVRRAYLQFVIDPLVRRFNRPIAERRADIKLLLDAQNRNGVTASTTSLTDVFPSVTRSLVAAADARIEELARRSQLARDNQTRLSPNLSEAERGRIATENRSAQQAISDRTALTLSEATERGAVLAFYFAEALRGVEESGFDIANSLADIFTNFNAQRELTRLAENKEARTRGETLRRRERENLVAARAATNAIDDSTPADARNAQLAESLKGVQELLRVNKYEQAEAELLELRRRYQADPRILFALAQAASAAAQDAIDETVRDERLNKAISNYRLAIDTARATGDTEAATNRALLSRAFVATARILAFQDKPKEAAAAFDEAIKLGEVAGGAYREALADKGKLPR